MYRYDPEHIKFAALHGESAELPEVQGQHDELDSLFTHDIKNHPDVKGVIHWQGPSYEEMNRHYRGDSKLDAFQHQMISQKTRKLDSVFSTTSHPLPHDVSAYRGLGHRDRQQILGMKEGQPLQFHGVTAGSLSPNVGFMFAKAVRQSPFQPFQQDFHMSHMMYPKGSTKALYIGGVDKDMESEREIIGRHGMKATYFGHDVINIQPRMRVVVHHIGIKD